MKALMSILHFLLGYYLFTYFQKLFYEITHVLPAQGDGTLTAEYLYETISFSDTVKYYLPELLLAILIIITALASFSIVYFSYSKYKKIAVWLPIIVTAVSLPISYHYYLHAGWIEDTVVLLVLIASAFFLLMEIIYGVRQYDQLRSASFPQ